MPSGKAQDQLRAGSRTLALFAYSLNARILQSHADGPLRTAELEERIGWAAQSSLRVAVNGLCELGILARSESGNSSAPTELTEGGRELLVVASSLENWLRYAPEGPIPLADAAARGTIRVLAAGWDSTVVRAMAEQPLTLSELNASIPSISYPALKRRLSKLRATGLVAPVDGGRYEATEWLRRAVVPLAVAGRWELEHDPNAEPISPVEVEAAFLLTLPMVSLPAGSSGACTLAVLTSDDQADSEPEPAGAAVEVRDGRVVPRGPEIDSRPATWALGTSADWLAAVIEGRDDALRIGGAQPGLVEGIVRGIHKTLFLA